MNPNIYEYIKEQETAFETEEIQVGDNWSWSFRNHVQMIFHLKNGMFFTGDNNWLRAFKNIMEPILNLWYWTEDIDVKDVLFYIEEKEGKVLSFLVKKYHDEVYVKEHDLDMLFDEITESDVDYGGVIVQKGVDMPEVKSLKEVAFCDQTDILGSPSAFKLFFSPSRLREMSKYGWGEESNGATISLEDLCTLASADKDSDTLSQKKNKVPGKTIEAYIVRGNMPDAYLKDNDDMEYYCNQLQIIAFYTKKDSTKEGVTLYRKKEEDGNIKFFTSKKVEGRGLGRGAGEIMLHPQIWTNFETIHKMGLLEAGAKVGLYTDDPTYTTKNKIQDMENLEITTIEDNKRIYQIPTASPTNIQLFTNDINDWFAYAQTAGSAQDPIMGKEGSSGTTFRGQERSVAQGRGSHDRRRGKRAKFIEEIYRDWILPDIKKQILKGKKFLATLSTEEMQWISDQVVANLVNRHIKDIILTGGIITKEEQDALTQKLKQDFLKKGNKHLLEILKGEFEDIEIKMGINVAGKQKDLVQLSDKLLSIFQFIFQNPAGFQQAMQIPALAKSFENLLEFGGMSIIDFSSLLQAPVQQAQLPTGLNPNEIAPSAVQVPQLALK